MKFTPKNKFFFFYVFFLDELYEKQNLKKIFFFSFSNKI